MKEIIPGTKRARKLVGVYHWAALLIGSAGLGISAYLFEQSGRIDQANKISDAIDGEGDGWIMGREVEIEEIPDS